MCQPLPLTDGSRGVGRYDGWDVSVYGERVRAVVHDGAVVIRCSQVVDSHVFNQQPKVSFLSWN